MKKALKTILFSLLAAFLLSALIFGIAASDATVGDPSDSYEKELAEFDDPTIDLWFEHSFKKIYTSDTAPSDMDTYSVYMARNEKENAQFVLYSDTDKTGLTATVTDFTNMNGDTVSATLYYQMYLTVSNLDTGSVLGLDSESSIIREGEVPDPMVPLDNINRLGGFKLNGKKSQAFYIQLETDKSTPAGWYSAQLDIKNSAKETVKTAQVFCYVWDFEIKDGPTLQTSFLIDNNLSYGGNYTAFYEYFIDNRLMPMDMPGGFYADNPYITDERVSAIRVSASGGGYNRIYADGPESYPEYKALYNALVNSGNWEEIKDKFYFYTIDEPRAQEVCDRDTHLFRTNTVDGAKYYAKILKNYWPDAQIVIPMYDNHPYPYYTYHQPLASYEPYQIKDAVQELMDTESVTIWCPMTLGFTPQYELEAYGYDGTGWPQLRSYSGSHSGIYTTGSAGNWTYHDEYFNWESLYGEFSDRVLSQIAVEEEKGNKYQLWGYVCGASRTYTYTNHLPENTGLQTRLLFWQLYQEDCTGYLYYGTNNWNEYDKSNNKYEDTTVTGNLTQLAWKPNLSIGRSNGKDVYGDGVLFYGASQAKIRGINSYIGTIRVEMLRDGVEEYEMLCMLEEYRGEKAAKDTVARLSKNVVNYISLPGFSTAEWDSSMDEYDIMASVRKDLGFDVEAAVLSGKCDHRYDDGTVVLEATCVEMGLLRRTCKDCGAVTDEYIPTLHAAGDCYTVISETEPTCESEGSKILKCSVCNNTKTVTTKAYHDTDSSLHYEYTSDDLHAVYCLVCEEKLTVTSHDFFEHHTSTCTKAGQVIDRCSDCGFEISRGEAEAKGHRLVSQTKAPTCTEDGRSGTVCKSCDYSEAEIIPALGHSYVDGCCANCGEEDPEFTEDTVIPGDIDGDGKINSKDSNILKRIVSGSLAPTEYQRKAGDVNNDGAVNAIDANLITRLAAGAN